MKECKIIGGDVIGLDTDIETCICYMKKLEELKSKEEELKAEGKLIAYGKLCYDRRAMIFVRIEDKDYYVEVLSTYSVGYSPHFNIVVRDCQNFLKVTGRFDLRKVKDIDVDKIKDLVLQKIVDRVEKGKWVE